MRTRWSKAIFAGAVASALMGGTALAQSVPAGNPCGMPGLVKASVSEELAETFIVPFAANSSELSPVAARILDIAAASYPQQPTLYLRIQGGERASETETLVKIDRLAWVTAYLTQRDVPLEALVFEEPSMAQRTGCVAPDRLTL
ncbi:MAG: hypothetical protein AB7R90_18670 [Reyranellaceae bacterium]